MNHATEVAAAASGQRPAERHAQAAVSCCSHQSSTTSLGFRCVTGVHPGRVFRRAAARLRNNESAFRPHGRGSDFRCLEVLSRYLQESVRGGAAWFLGAQQHSWPLAQQMAAHSAQLPEHAKQLHLLYLANDIVLKSCALSESTHRKPSLLLENFRRLGAAEAEPRLNTQPSPACRHTDSSVDCTSRWGVANYEPIVREVSREKTCSFEQLDARSAGSGLEAHNAV